MTITRDEHGRAHFGAVEGCLQLLILINLIGFSIETLPGLSEEWKEGLWWLETFSVVIFSVEYLLRVTLSRPLTRYLFSIYSLIDLISILPYYLGLTFDLRSMRAIRLMRVFRLFKLARYSAAMRRYHLAFQYAKEELVLFGAAALIVLYLAAVGIYYFENERQPAVYSSVFHSLWWAIVTLTTVGYGDVVPLTAGGRIFTGFVLIAGLGIVAVPTGLLAAALSKARDHEKEAEKAALRDTDSGNGP